MTDLLLQFAASNLLVSIPLAMVAYAVHRTGRFPVIAHLLWIIVLAKLVTPPLVTIRVGPVPGLEAAAMETPAEVTDVIAAPAGALDAGSETAGPGALRVWLAEDGRLVLLLLWLVGSMWVFAWSVLRIHRFHRLLRTASRPAGLELQRAARQLAGGLGLKSAPTIYTTAAHLSPMVWWVGGRVRIIIPKGLPNEMDAEGLRWVLAHELAHVRRGDHYVRWLEWLACVVFWWNPVAWLARRNLRINEEICCDNLVLASLEPAPRTYANALMEVVEFLSAPVIRPPAVASEMNSGGFLERRFKMIVSKNKVTKTPRWLRAGVLLLAAAMLPLGVAYGQDYEAVGRRLRAAVQEGELTKEQARAMMHALQETAPSDKAERGAKKVRAEKDVRAAKKAFAQAEAELRKAVEAGRISGADARKKLAAMREKMSRLSDRVERRISREDYARAEVELKKAVAAGKVSEKDARTRLREMRERVAERSDRAEPRLTREDYSRAEAELRKAIESGRISKADATKRLNEMRKMMGGDRDRQSDRNRARTDRRRVRTDRADEVDWEAATKRVERAVKSGRMTRKEADAAHRELRQRAARGRDRETDRAPERGAVERKRRERDNVDRKTRERDVRGVELDAVRKHIEAAVKSGEMTRVEAEVALRETRKRAAMQKADRGAEREKVRRKRTRDGADRNRKRSDRAEADIDWEAVKKRIESAVERGEMTRKEADAAYTELRKRAAGDRKDR